jgi:hypothetical protein
MMDKKSRPSSILSFKTDMMDKIAPTKTTYQPFFLTYQPILSSYQPHLPAYQPKLSHINHFSRFINESQILPPELN